MAAAKIKVVGPEDDASKEQGQQASAPADANTTKEDREPKANEAAETLEAEEAGAEEAAEAGETVGDAAAEGEIDEAAVAAEADAIVGEAAAAADEAGADATVDGGDALAEELKAAQQAAAEAKDKYLRLQAEWDNFRKRTAAERDSEKQRATETLVKELLPVIDDFERAIAHAKTNPDVTTLTEGVEAVHSKFLDVLGKAHVVQISPKGEAFDANRHQAVGTQEDAEAFDETVVQVYQCGYEMGGHVIRPAMVVVSTGGPKRPPEDAEDAPEENKE